MRPFKNHLQITGENRINQTPSEHRRKAFGEKSRRVSLAPSERSEDHFLKKMSIKISWSVSAPSCATTYIVLKEPCFRRYCTPLAVKQTNKKRIPYQKNFGSFLGTMKIGIRSTYPLLDPYPSPNLERTSSMGQWEFNLQLQVPLQDDSLRRMALEPWVGHGMKG